MPLAAVHSGVQLHDMRMQRDDEVLHNELGVMLLQGQEGSLQKLLQELQHDR